MKKTITQIPVAQLKARLSEILRRVRAGNELIVTDRGVPVARLVPMGTAPDAEALIRDGLARGPQQALPKDFWTRRRVADRDGRLVAIVQEERADDR